MNPTHITRPITDDLVKRPNSKVQLAPVGDRDRDRDRDTTAGMLVFFLRF